MIHIDLGSLVIPAWVAVVFGMAAMGAGVLSYLHGHNLIMLAVVFSIGWMTLGYFFYAIGSFDQEDLNAVVRSGFVTLCLDFIVGGWYFYHRRKPK